MHADAELRRPVVRMDAVEKKVYLALLLAIILTGWGLAVVRLGERSLWADEGATAYLAQQLDSPSRAIELHKDFPFLHLFITMGTVRLSRSEFALRFPSAMAATLTLPVLYLLGRRLLNGTAGLVAAFLLAISPFAVGYAQEARAYALLELLACTSLLLLLLALAQRRWYWWAGFAVSTFLLLYTHLFAWFVVAAQILFAFVVLLWQTARERRLDPRLPALAISLVAIAILYLPLVPALSGYWQRHGPGRASIQGAGLYPFQLSFRFFRDMLGVFGARSWDWPLWLFGVGILLGLLSLVVLRKWKALLLITLWLAVPVIGLAVLSSEHFFEYRHLIFILPIFLLVTAQGITWVVSLLVRTSRLPRPRLVQPILALGLASLLFIPANLPALQTHYRSEKENWRDIATFIGHNLQPDEAIYISPQFWANPLLFYQPSLEPYVVGGSSIDVNHLERAAQQAPGLWYLRHAAPIGDPTGALTGWITGHQFDLVIDGYVCGRGIHVYYRRSDPSSPAEALARQAELLRQAAIFCPADPRFQSPPD